MYAVGKTFIKDVDFKSLHKKFADLLYNRNCVNLDITKSALQLALF